MNISQIYSTKPFNLCLSFISVGSRDRFRLEEKMLTLHLLTLYLLTLLQPLQQTLGCLLTLENTGRLYFPSESDFGKQINFYKQGLKEGNYMRVKVEMWKGGVRGDEGSCTADKLVVPWVPTLALVGSLLNTIITTTRNPGRMGS